MTFNKSFLCLVKFTSDSHLQPTTSCSSCILMLLTNKEYLITLWWGINDIRCLSISIFPSSAIWYLRDLTHLTICVLYCLNMYYANQRLNTIGLRLQFLVYALKNPNYFKCSKSSQCPSRYFRQKANLLLPMILLTQCLSDSMIFVSLMFLLSTFNIFVVIIKGFGKSSSLSLICKKGHYEHKIWDKMFLHQKSNL